MGRATKTLQYALLAAAGGASFYLAAHLRPASPDAAAADDDVVEPATGAERAVPTSARVADAVQPASVRDADLALPRSPRDVPAAGGDPFGPRSWLPPAPPPPPAPVVVAAPPAAPVAPPLPYSFVGMLESGGAQPQAFLARGDALLVVSAGDLLDNNTYRVDTLGPQGIVMTYLPMNTKHTLTVSGATP